MAIQFIVDSAADININPINRFKTRIDIVTMIIKMVTYIDL